MVQRSQDIKAHLVKEDVQERIQQLIKHGRSEAVVTIGRAARLFDFSETKLRDWENLKLLNPVRSKDVTGQRQYSFTELDKLAIIKELIEAGFSPNDIPPDIDDIWYAISFQNKEKEKLLGSHKNDAEEMPIDKRAETGYSQELFWRYYISHVLRISLALICEDIPEASRGLMLPLHENRQVISISSPEELSRLGECLVGWQGRRSFSTFIAKDPTFLYPSDFRVLPLQEMIEDKPFERSQKGGVWILVPRRAKALTFTQPVVETVRRLLAPLFNQVRNWYTYLGQGMRDIFDPVIDYSNSSQQIDAILTGFADLIVDLGAKDSLPMGPKKWCFCTIQLPVTIMSPTTARLPLQQQSLIVRAKSKDAPIRYRVGITTFVPQDPLIGLNLRAYQGGNIVYRSKIIREDSTLDFNEMEETTRSALAVPLEGEDNLPAGVLYVASNEVDAFSKADQRLLRMVGRLVGELLMVYQVRYLMTRKLSSLMTRPVVVDPSFQSFKHENAFINDVENLLKEVKAQSREEEGEAVEIEETFIDAKELFTAEHQSQDVVSFIAVDIDNQSNYSNKYGDQVTRNLSREVGQRIQGQFSAHFWRPDDYKIYHIYADRFYIMLKEASLALAREEAEKLRQKLNGSYYVSASADQQVPKEYLIELKGVTVRLAVTSYRYKKLKQVLSRYSDETAATEVRVVLMGTLDEGLNMAKAEGGNKVIAWDLKEKKFVLSSPRQEG